MKTIITLASAAAALAFAAPASADLYSFLLTGTDGFAAEGASFQIDSATAPTDYATGVYVGYGPISGTFSYDTDTDTSAFVDFYPTANLGGIGFQGVNNDNVFVVADGPQLYVGPESHPTGFNTGTFQLTDDFTGLGGAQITITDLTTAGGTPAVPEPASWALMITGFGFVGAGMRRRTTRLVQAV